MSDILSEEEEISPKSVLKIMKAMAKLKEAGGASTEEDVETAKQYERVQRQMKKKKARELALAKESSREEQHKAKRVRESGSDEDTDLYSEIFGEASTSAEPRVVPPPLAARKEELSKLSKLESLLESEELTSVEGTTEACKMFTALINEIEDFMADSRNLSKRSVNFLSPRIRKLRFLNNVVMRKTERLHGFVEGYKVAAGRAVEEPTAGKEVLFSEAVKRVKVKPAKVIFIDKADKDESSVEFKKKILKEINPRVEGLHIHSCRENPRGMKIVAADSDTERKIKENKGLLGLKVKFGEQKKLRPRMRIFDIDRTSSEAEVLENIRIQNTKLSKEEFESRFKVLYKGGNRNSSKVDYIVEVDKELRILFDSVGRLFINYDSCKIKDYINITRCYKCSGLGHVAKYCKSEELCSYCTEKGHVFKDCPKKVANEKPTCINCKKVNKRSDHSSSSFDCPAYIAARENLIRRTDV